MTPYHPLFIIIIYVIAYLSAFIITKTTLKPQDIENQKFETISGLRGFLALGVFIYHIGLWYQFLQIGKWKELPIAFSNQIGQVCVMLFFMITSFLFTHQLLQHQNIKEFNWRRFFKGRWYRLAPLYFTSIFFIILSTMIACSWQWNMSFGETIISIINWCVFTIYQSSRWNHFEFNSQVNAGVFWSLTYEWLYYFTLPLIAWITLKSKPTRLLILITLVFWGVFLGVHGVKLHFLLAFLGGSFAPFLLRKFSQPSWIQSHLTSFFILLLLSFILFHFPNSEEPICIFLIAVIFTLIALGNPIFGILKHKPIQFLGQISYSTYLFHGLLLFNVFYFGIGINRLKSYQTQDYCLLTCAITPLLIGISTLGYFFIEKKWILRGK